MIRHATGMLAIMCWRSNPSCLKHVSFCEIYNFTCVFHHHTIVVAFAATLGQTELPRSYDSVGIAEFAFELSCSSPSQVF